MIEQKKEVKPTNNVITLRIPKLNTQVVILGLVALITLFQTFQLVRISTAESTASVKTAPSAAVSGSSGTDSNADIPQSMVGGC